MPVVMCVLGPVLSCYCYAGTYMFRSQIDHHQGDKIFVLTSVTKFNFIDVAACLL